MTDEDLRRQLFTVEATRIAAQVQHACALASGLELPSRGFDLIHQVLNKCIDEISRYEARTARNAQRLASIPTPSGSKDDGN